MQASLPEFDANAYVAHAMAMDNGLDLGVAVGHSVSQQPPVEGIPEDAPEESEAEVTHPSTEQDDVEATGPQPETPQPTATEADYWGGDAGPETPAPDVAEALQQLAGSDAEADGPREAWQADDVSIEPPSVEDNQEPVGDLTPESQSENKQGDFEPEPVASQRDTNEADFPENVPERPAVEEIDLSFANTEGHPLEDSFEYTAKVNDPEVYEFDDIQWQPANPYGDELRMDLDDPLGPSVPRRGGY